MKPNYYEIEIFERDNPETTIEVIRYGADNYEAAVKYVREHPYRSRGRTVWDTGSIENGLHQGSNSTDASGVPNQ